MIKWFISRVLPGRDEVFAKFLCRHSMFISEDLPTLDLPMNANSGNFCLGFSDILVLLPENNASVIFILMMVSKTVANIGNLFYLFI